MQPLRGESFFTDRRVIEAKRLLREALAEHQAALDGPRPADPRRAERYERLIERFGALRGGPLYYPYLDSGFGRGALVELADGSVKYDMITGIGVHGFGHADGELLDAALDAALRDTIMQGNLQQNAESAALCEELTAAAAAHGARLSHCFLTTSGAMANENALKLIFQAKRPADRLLAFRNCFMGRTLATAAITDRPGYREGLPPTLAVDYVPFCDPADPRRSTDRAVAALTEHLDRHPGRHAAMCFELVQGEGGYYPGTREFFTALIEPLRQRGIAVLIDEVQTFGRTGELFAFQHFGLDELADVVTIGKMSQVCATLFTDEYLPKPGLISQTFTGSTSAIFAARAILRRLRAGGFFGEDGRIARMHRRFVERFDAIARDQPGRLTGPFGIGGMIAFRVFDGGAAITKKVLRALFDDGVIAFIAGAELPGACRVRFLPPIGVIGDEDIDAVCDILRSTLGRVADPRAR